MFYYFTVVAFRFYKGIVPLWGRQIPYTMMKFACFERTVEALYKFVVPKPRSECSKAEQLVVTFCAGYIGKAGLQFNFEFYYSIWYRLIILELRVYHI